MSDDLPQTLLLGPGETMPNSRLPVLIYRAEAGGFEAMFAANGWVGIWRNGVYDFDHYHSNAHEVLGVEAGHATLRLGGAEGQDVEISTGDVVVLPAGTGHRRITRSSDFVVVGALSPRTAKLRFVPRPHTGSRDRDHQGGDARERPRCGANTAPC